MKRTLGLLLVVFVAFATLATTKSAGYTCSLTGQHIEQCCCTSQAEGKLYCTLAKKTIDSCCCKPAEK